MDGKRIPNIEPRLLTSKEAAAYVRLPVAQFVRLRLAMVCFGRKVLYDRIAIDAYLDGISGLDSRVVVPTQDDPEAALARFTADLENDSRRSPGP